MKGKGKYISIVAAVITLILVAVGIGYYVAKPGDLPSGVSTTTPSVTSITPKPSPSTTTVTVTRTPIPTETASTINPPPPPPPTTTPSTVPSGCVQDGVDTAGWNTDPDSNTVNPEFVGPLAPPSASTGPCFDKLVFTVQTGTGVEFNAGYVPAVKGGGSDIEVTDIKGSKFIQLTIKATMLRDEQGNPLYNPADYNIPDAHGFGNLRELRLVTPDYEGYTTFGIGVDTMTPLAVESNVLGEGFSEVVVYIVRPHR